MITKRERKRAEREREMQKDSLTDALRQDKKVKKYISF